MTSLGIGASFPTKSLLTLNDRVGKGFAALASGDRIHRASVDAAGLAISESLRAIIGSRTQGVRNLNDGISAVRVAEGALEETSRNLVRMRELSMQAQNGTLGDAQRQVIQDEFDAMASEVSRVAATTDFNGRKLLDGSAGGGGAIEFVDGSSAAPIALSLGDQSGASLGIEGLDASNGGSLDAIDAAIASVSAARAELGTTESRLSSSIRSAASEIENVAAAESRIRDTDFASATATLTRDLTLRAANIAVRAQANLDASTVLRFFGPLGRDR